MYPSRSGARGRRPRDAYRCHNSPARSDDSRGTRAVAEPEEVLLGVGTRRSMGRSGCRADDMLLLAAVPWDRAVSETAVRAVETMLGSEPSIDDRRGTCPRPLADDVDVGGRGPASAWYPAECRCGFFCRKERVAITEATPAVDELVVRYEVRRCAPTGVRRTFLPVGARCSPCRCGRVGGVRYVARHHLKGTGARTCVHVWRCRQQARVAGTLSSVRCRRRSRLGGRGHDAAPDVDGTAGFWTFRQRRRPRDPRRDAVRRQRAVGPPVRCGPTPNNVIGAVVQWAACVRRVYPHHAHGRGAAVRRCPGLRVRPVRKVVVCLPAAPRRHRRAIALAPHSHRNVFLALFLRTTECLQAPVVHALPCHGLGHLALPYFEAQRLHLLCLDERVVVPVGVDDAEEQRPVRARAPRRVGGRPGPSDVL
eukprot:PhM_4_TR5835/c0_g1_i1/m.57082